MVKEVDHQRDIKESAIREGGFSFKMSNRFLIGVPDLYIAMPGYPACLLEVKRNDDYATPGVAGHLRDGLTEKQKSTLSKVWAAQAYAGWFVIVRDGKETLGYLGGPGFGEAKTWFRRGEKKHWPVQDIVATLTALHLVQRGHLIQNEPSGSLSLRSAHILD
jgi:hypothetical protein